MHSKISLFSNFLFGFTVFSGSVISPTAFMVFLMSQLGYQNPGDCRVGNFHRSAHQIWPQSRPDQFLWCRTSPLSTKYGHKQALRETQEAKEKEKPRVTSSPDTPSCPRWATALLFLETFRMETSLLSSMATSSLSDTYVHFPQGDPACSHPAPPSLLMLLSYSRVMT